MNIQDLINHILSKVKVDTVTDSDKASGSAYRPEPIIRTAAELNLLKEYREMRKIRPSYDIPNHAVIQFYQQAVFMADFEDDYEFHGEYNQYYPTYQSMNDSQLRGYFSWRTKVRNGLVYKTSLSFVFVYIYELLNNIGVSSPMEGYSQLLFIWESYKEYEPKITGYITHWLRDYIIYYGLDSKLLEEYGEDVSKQLDIIYNFKNVTPKILAEALNSFSNYNITKSKFYNYYAKDYEEALYRVYSELSLYFDKHRKHPLFTKLFGSLNAYPYNIFGSAVFNRDINREDREYVVNSCRKYFCRGGSWYRYCCSNVSSRNKAIGEILKNIDCIMREKYRFPYPLTCVTSSKLLFNVMEKTIDSYCIENGRIDAYTLAKKKKKKQQAEEEKVAPAPVVIDSSRFDEIRRNAELIQEKLIVDEEGEADEFVTEAKRDAAEDTTAEVKGNAAASPSDLTDDEKVIIRAILDGDMHSLRSFAKSKGILLSVAVESINEKLFELVGDNVIEMQDDMPAAVEDYINDLNEVLEK